MLFSWKRLFSITLLCLLPFSSLAKAQEPILRVGLLDNQGRVTISAQEDFVMKVPSMDRIFRFPMGKQLAFNFNQGKLLLNNKPLPSDNIIIAVKNNAPVLVNGRPYRGALNLVINSRGITVVNRIPMEAYLYGVVPAEMPYSWPGEALKAQAVAARSFALNYKNKHQDANKPYDLCSTTACQVYNGINEEKSSVTKAVNATRGQVLTYNNMPIAAAFHAASGGSTISSSEGWGSPQPYLQGVMDSKEKSPYSHWVKEYTATEFQQILQRKFPSIKPIKKIDLSHYPRNKVNTQDKKIIFQDSSGKSFSLTGAQMRSLYKLDSSNFTIESIYPAKTSAPKTKLLATPTTSQGAIKINTNGKRARRIKGNIYQNNPQVVPQPITPTTTSSMNNNKNDLPLKFKIIGSGFGHRIGMSQWGAKGEAESGKDYTAILKHYYTGVQIQQLYN